MAGRRRAGIQYDADAGPDLGEVRTNAPRDADWVQVRCRSDDGARDPGGWRGVGRDRVLTISARARRSAEQPSAGERDGGGRKAARTASRRPAARVWASLLWTERSAYSGGHQTRRYSVLKKERMDGVKFFLDAPTNGNGAEAWVLFRASGTEPLLRLYTEASSPELVKELLGVGESFVRNG